MKKKLYIDCDIILDLLAERQPFYQYTAQLFTLIEEGKVEGYVSSLTFANLFYILRKLKSNQEAKNILIKLRLLLNILPVDEKIVEMALNSSFNDFEDAIQYYAAMKNGIGTIITRNKKDYRDSKVLVLDAEEYLRLTHTVTIQSC